VSGQGQIVWIDDNPTRERVAAELRAKFVNGHRVKLETPVENLLKGRKPRLVILDHVLDKTATTNPLFMRGSTIAEAIKEKWPDCPVVGVTNISNLDEIDQRTRRTYDALFRYYNFSEYLDRIRSIANGFALITRSDPSNEYDLINLLKPPQEEIDRLVAALPDELKQSLDASVASRLYRWIDHLSRRPGFLFDQLWAATIIGLNKRGWEIVEPQFERAKYKGVFADREEIRWWSSQLTAVLFKLEEPQPGELSWHVGRRFVSAEYFSRCYRCGGEYPEIVAYLDSGSDERRAMHLDCTTLHPHYKRELYFEDIRMMRE
jgi:DNA-binding NarL/FixJ family response regulator